MNTIRNRILTTLAATALVPLAVLFLLTDSMIRSSILTAESEKIEKINRQLAHHVKTLMQGYADDLKSLQTDPILADRDAPPELRLRQMHRLVKIYEFFSDISLYDREGYLIDSTVDTDHPTYHEFSRWFKEALNTGEPSISHPHRQIGETGLNLSVYLPVFDPDGTINSILQARVSFHLVSEMIQSVHPGKDGKIILVDNWGAILSAADDDLLLERLDENRNLSHWATEPLGEYTDGSGEKFLTSVEIIPGRVTHLHKPWGLVAFQPMKEINALIQRAHLVLMIATLATIMAASLIGILVSTRISKPLVNLSRTAQDVAHGDLSVRAEPTGSIELRELSNSFNQMVSDLREYQEGLENLVDSRTHSLNLSRKEHEETSAHLQAALEGSNNGFLVEGMGGQIVAVNQLFLDLFELNRAQVSGRRIEDVIDEIFGRAKSESDTDVLREAIQNPGITVDQEIVFESPTLRYLDVHSAPIRKDTAEIIGRVWTLRDNTENRQLEESLRQSQKMEAIGQLAGGVAHDFNNLLTGILGNLSLVEIDSKSDADARNLQLLESAINASDRAAELVKNLLGFSRRSHMDLRPCDANKVLREINGLLEATVDPSIGLFVELEESPWGVMADANLLSQVIMNMAVNAKDALEGRKDGFIRLVSSNTTLNKKSAQLYNGISDGDYVLLSVEDNGEGIPDDVQKRIFEPFFTTKEPGKGTGLGLATSFGIIKQLGGCIHFESETGAGTRFDVFLPRSVVAEAQPREEHSRSELKLIPENHEETLLLVDDEDLVRSVGVSLLERLGYRTLVASNGEEALEIYEQNEGTINLIVLDLTMPGLSGAETLRKLREDFSYVPVLICSGYLVDIKEIEKECGYCPDGFVQKPYQVETISETITRILDAA